VEGQKFSVRIMTSHMVVHNCNPSLGELRQEDYEFKANLAYTENLSPQKELKG
jgi:hypothetical protein